MNIKMRSDDINHQGRVGNRPRFGSTNEHLALGWRQVFVCLAALCLLVTLAACASGDADEAKLAEERDATKPAILPGVEATKIVATFFPATPPPASVPTYAPGLSRLVLTTRVESSGEPSDDVSSFLGGSAVFADAQISHLMAGQTVRAIWTDSVGSELARTEVPVSTSSESAWVPLQWKQSGLSTGQYVVYVYVDDRLLNSLVFTVG